MQGDLSFETRKPARLNKRAAWSEPRLLLQRVWGRRGITYPAGRWVELEMYEAIRKDTGECVGQVFRSEAGKPWSVRGLADRAVVEGPERVKNVVEGWNRIVAWFCKAYGEETKR